MCLRSNRFLELAGLLDVEHEVSAGDELQHEVEVGLQWETLSPSLYNLQLQSIHPPTSHLLAFVSVDCIQTRNAEYYPQINRSVHKILDIHIAPATFARYLLHCELSYNFYKDINSFHTFTALSRSPSNFKHQSKSFSRDKKSHLIFQRMSGKCR